MRAKPKLNDDGILNLPQLEEQILKFWKENGVFEKLLDLRRRGKPYKFYEGPPYANGRPGLHHILARVFKDIVLRFKSMQGYYVPRRAGWDTHGLPIEIETEKRLGIKSKKEIEKLGIAFFNQKAKDSVWQYKDEWEKMTERIGYWLNLKDAYVTYKNDYIESLWWIFKEIQKRGFLRKDYKVVPYCPRCETPLASHELGMPGAYQNAADPSIFVKFKIKKYPRGRVTARNEYLLVWTTTPWTLPANTAVALNSKLTYTKFRVNNEYLWSYGAPPTRDGDKVEVAEKISGQKLLGLEYEQLYKFGARVSKSRAFFKVYGADFVSTEEGTGFVHIAPAFGENDMNLMRSVDKDFSWDNIPITATEDGKVTKGLPGAGKFVKAADEDIMKDLVRRDLLFFRTQLEHEYPFCWRCGTPLLYFARPSWFIEMSRLRQALVKANKKINWIPEYLKEGRFGEWIREAKDWAISRERYWGTPIPVWECSKCDNYLVAGGLEDLNKYSSATNKFWALRHTEGEHIIKKVIASGPEKTGRAAKLTPRGVQMAKRIALELKAKNIDIIYASPYVRTRTVAQIVAKVVRAKLVLDKRLGELNAGVFNWKKIDNYDRFFKNDLERFEKTPEGGENLNDVRKRCLSFIREVNSKHKNKNILVVGHGDVLWMLQAVAGGLDKEPILKLKTFRLGELREVKLNNYPLNDNGELDLHRPFADEVRLSCPKCASTMKRVKDVADVWFDSGAMPFASAHYPFENRKFIEGPRALGFPADYICEAIDQTRGWFYTLLAVSVLLGRGEPFKNVISLGLVLDKHGQKMSKTKGNVVDPWEVMGKYGVDSIRWYFYTINPPAEPKRFDEAEVQKSLRRFIMIFYNSYVFYKTYAEIKKIQKPKCSNVLDKWIMVRFNLAIKETTRNLSVYDIHGAAKNIEELADDLSRWYIRRSRRRFQKPSSKADYLEAAATLYYVLLEFSKITAPFIPFVSEGIYQLIGGEKESVHLEGWPRPVHLPDEKKVLTEMEWVRKTAAMVLAKRAEAGVKVRQPLGVLKLQAQGSKLKISRDLLEVLKDEVNVKEIIFDPDLKEDVWLDVTITPVLREEGILREIVRLVQELRHGARFKPRDKISLFVEAGYFSEILDKYKERFSEEVGAQTLEFRKSDKFDAEFSTKIEDVDVWLGVKKMAGRK